MRPRRIRTTISRLPARLWGSWRPSLLDVCRWLCALSLAWVGWDFARLAHWFARWDGGFSPTSGLWHSHGLLRTLCRWIFPQFWKLPELLVPSLLIGLSVGAFWAGIRRSRAEVYLLGASAFLAFGFLQRHTTLRSQADTWLVLSTVFLLLARRWPNPWAGVWRIQCLAVYFFAGVQKWAEPSWRSGESLVSAVHNPFLSTRSAQWIAELPGWCLLALAAVTIGQRVFAPWLFLLEDRAFAQARLLRRVSVIGFALMHVGYWLFLDVGTFATTGLISQVGLWEDSSRQLGKPGWKLWRGSRLAAAAAVGVLLAPAASFVTTHYLAERHPELAIDSMNYLPAWNMFAGVGRSNQYVIRFRVIYGKGADAIRWDPLRNLLGQDPRSDWEADPYEWSKFLWNWRLRFWLYSISPLRDPRPSDFDDPHFQAFARVLTQELSPQVLEGKPQTGYELQRYPVDFSVSGRR